MVGSKRRIEKVKTAAEDIIELLDHDDDNDKDSAATVATTKQRKPKNPAIAKGTIEIDIDIEMPSSDEGIDVKIPLSLLMTGTSAGTNECAVLVQVTPDDAPTLDFHGAGGAVGRFEVNDDTVMMDLKGFRFSGNLQAGPTCIVASMHPLIGENIIKVESITDEFVTLHKTGDQLKLLDAVVEKGDLDDSFLVKDTNVNLRERGSNANSISNISSKNKDDADNGEKKNSVSSKKESKPSKRRKK